MKVTPLDDAPSAKNCASCGGRPQLQMTEYETITNNGYTVFCAACGVGRNGWTITEAVKAWNKRPKRPMSAKWLARNGGRP